MLKSPALLPLFSGFLPELSELLSPTDQKLWVRLGWLLAELTSACGRVFWAVAVALVLVRVVVGVWVALLAGVKSR